VTERPAELWAEALQALANAVAHDLRNAFNAVAVNLEVVRSRSARGTEASAIAPFAATAASNFETASAAAEAMLALIRAEPGDTDVATILARIARLLAVRPHGTFTLVDRSDARAKTSASGDVARAVVARSVLTAVASGDAISCEITADDGIFLTVLGATRVPPLPDSELVTVAAAHGIHIAARGKSVELRFPAVDSRANPTVRP
jgi:signal transduction histidine kinase